MVMRTQTFRICIFICMCGMAYATYKEGFWLLLASVSLDGGPMPRADLVGTWTVVGFLISTCLYWKWPWIAVVIAWANMGVILLGVVPWVAHSWATFFHQFVYDHIFFVAANLGLLAGLLPKRSSENAGSVAPA
jgi:hypothetical protein